jgi:TrmH RNA methyltransferase
MPPTTINRRKTESKVYGQHACRAVFSRRPEDILRVYLIEELIPSFGELLHACAQRHLPYKVVGPEELEKITESRHHEGLCLVAKARPPVPLLELLRPPGPGVLLALAEVGNPHNLGAIVRSAAHFGARGVLVSGTTGATSGSALRTAQGGAEWVEVVTAPDPLRELEVCRRAGFTVGATSSHGGRSLYDQPMPARTVVLLGSEGQGLPPELGRAADVTWKIPGTGQIESLNVAAAAAVLLGEWYRQHRR